MIIDLIWFSQSNAPLPQWSMGETIKSPKNPSQAHIVLHSYLSSSKADKVLFWDDKVGTPLQEAIQRAAEQRGDVCHAGLKLGLSGLPRAINFVNPTWMLNCDPRSDISATSWRLSLSACLMDIEVLRQLGHIDPAFDTLTGASLDMGHRYITHGVLVRHVPELIPSNLATHFPPLLSHSDEWRFIARQYGRRWLRWAVFRSLRNGYSWRESLKAYLKVIRETIPLPAATYQKRTSPSKFIPQRWKGKISVLIPTLDRYPYLRTVLNQLHEQTIRPLEVICIDQTRLEERDETLVEEFATLPLRYTYRNQPGQCSSRNEGLLLAKGEYVLFLDDDVEIKPDLLEQHARFLDENEADASAGVADELGAGLLPNAFTFPRVSDVFPTTNTLIKKTILHDSGLFDLAYEKGERADGDLGTRIYLSGKITLLNPLARLFHYRAPRGGLRQHRARVITYAGSRMSLTKRQIPSPSQIYYWLRYFSLEQTQEACLCKIFATLSSSESLGKRIVRGILMGLLLPDTYRKTRLNFQKSKILFFSYPKIPSIDPNTKTGKFFSRKGT